MMDGCNQRQFKWKYYRCHFHVFLRRHSPAGCHHRGRRPIGGRPRRITLHADTPPFSVIFPIQRICNNVKIELQLFSHELICSGRLMVFWLLTGSTYDAYMRCHFYAFINTKPSCMQWRLDANLSWFVAMNRGNIVVGKLNRNSFMQWCNRLVLCYRRSPAVVSTFSTFYKFRKASTLFHILSMIDKDTDA